MAAPTLFARARRALALVPAAGFLVAGLALPASALDSVDPAEVRTPSGDACPELTAIKYPWITCLENEYGGVTLMLPEQPAPPECHWLMPDGECAASEHEWGIVPRVRNHDD